MKRIALRIQSQNSGLLWILIYFFLGLNVFNLMAPVLSSSTNPILQYLGAGIYFLLDPICHQLPDRCLFIRHLPMALCVRCTFIYLGVLLGLLVLLWQKRLRLNIFLVYGVFGFVAIEIFTEKIGLYVNWPLLRGFSGFLMGLFTVLYFSQFRAGSAKRKENSDFERGVGHVHQPQ